MKDWNTYFIEIAQLVATKSKDPSTKVGSVVVSSDHRILTTGYNGFPTGVGEFPERWERPEKYKWVVHSEINAILQASRFGVSLIGATLYLNFAPSSICTNCAKSIIQAGIAKIIGPDIAFPGKGIQWEEDLKLAALMLKEAGVQEEIQMGQSSAKS